MAAPDGVCFTGAERQRSMTAGITDPDSTPVENQSPPSTMRRDLVWAYVASGSKIASWAIVSAIVYRKAGKLEFGMLSMVRGTIGILNYTAPWPRPGDGAAACRIARRARNRQMIRLAHQRMIYSTGIVLAGSSLCVGVLGDCDLRSFLFSTASSSIAIDIAGPASRSLDRHRHDAPPLQRYRRGGPANARKDCHR